MGMPLYHWWDHLIALLRIDYESKHILTHIYLINFIFRDPLWAYWYIDSLQMGEGWAMGKGWWEGAHDREGVELGGLNGIYHI